MFCLWLLSCLCFTERASILNRNWDEKFICKVTLKMETESQEALTDQPNISVTMTLHDNIQQPQIINGAITLDPSTTEKFTEEIIYDCPSVVRRYSLVTIGNYTCSR